MRVMKSVLAGAAIASLLVASGSAVAATSETAANNNPAETAAPASNASPTMDDAHKGSLKKKRKAGFILGFLALAGGAAAIAADGGNGGSPASP